jgi:hypothetical protein
VGKRGETIIESKNCLKKFAHRIEIPESCEAAKLMTNEMERAR